MFFMLYYRRKELFFLTLIKKVVEYLFTRTGSLWYDLSKIGSGKMKTKYSAMDIAEWFLWYNNYQRDEQLDKTDNYDVYEGITHLKLQKLLYYAEGVYSAVMDNDIFKEKIMAWPHGPVVVEVYENFSENGSKELEFDDNYWNKIQQINNDNDVSNILQLVYENYAGYTAWQLREKTHVVGGPWQITVDKKEMQKEIDKKLIKDYFKNNIVRVNE